MPISLRCGLLIGAALTSCTLGELRAATAPRPNIVFILADDLGWSGLHCFGSEYYETPQIDRLATQGMRFDHAYANMMNCAPSRASIMSGQYVGRHQVLYVSHFQNRWKQTHGDLKPFRLLQPDYQPSLPTTTLTVAESLQKAGYTTGMFGKWHLGRRDQQPSKRGFDVAIESSGKHFNFKTDPEMDHPPGQYLSDFLGDHASQFIRRAHQAGKPFFLYLPDFLVHAPLETKQAYLEHFKNKPPSKNHRSPVAAAMIKSLDDTVGHILRVLDETGIADQTLVIFGSDNGGLAYVEDGARGENTSNLPLRGRKGSEFEGGFRVPYIVRWPGRVPAGTTSHESISGADLYPTLLEVAGAPPPAHVLDGTSLVPLFADPAATLPQRELIWYLPHYTSFNRPCIVVRRGDWKLIHLFDSGRDELYHTGKDIGERHDLAGAHPALARELRERAFAWMAEAGAPPMRPNPDFDPAVARTTSLQSLPGEP